jgi:hypothetical protein
MGTKILANPTENFNREQVEIFDDFQWYVTAHLWTAAVAATGTVTNPATAEHVIRLFSTADNDAAVLATTNEMFKFVAGKAMVAEGHVHIAGPSSDVTLCSAAFGWADALAATSVADTTGAITATDACVIYKITGSDLWRFHTEINGSATASISSTASSVSTNQVLRIEVQPRSSTVLEARPFVDGVQLKTSAGVPIKHDITLGTATDLDFGWVFKGHHADDAILLSDYVYAAQHRVR